MPPELDSPQRHGEHRERFNAFVVTF
jgi:hypothetical protein